MKRRKYTSNSKNRYILYTYRLKGGMTMQHDRYSRLADITKMIHLKLDKRSVLEQVVKAISEEIVRCDAVGIYLPIAEDKFQGFVGKPDNFNGITLDQMVIDLNKDRFAAEIVATKKSIYIPDTSQDDRPDPIPIELFRRPEIV